MTTLLQTILLAIVQGITEWLPVSSSGHMLLLENMLGITENMGLILLFHLSSALVILLTFRKEIFQILAAFYRMDFQNKYGKLGLSLIIGSVPLGLIGYFLRDFVISFFASLFITGIGFIITGCFLLIGKQIDNKLKRKKNKHITFTNSFIIGLFQTLALVPGISRSGMTIGSGFILGLTKKDAFLFSFLLGLLAILGASILELPSLTSVPLLPGMIGFIICFIVGYYTLQFTLTILEKETFFSIGWYCLGIGILTLLYTLF